MGFTVLNASQYTIRLKATIHSSGKLGFTEATARELGFGDKSFVKFAQDDDDKAILYGDVYKLNKRITKKSNKETEE